MCKVLDLSNSLQAWLPAAGSGQTQAWWVQVWGVLNTEKLKN